jgi:hypothetical protein
MFRIVYFRGLYRYRNFLERFQYIVESFWSETLVAVSCKSEMELVWIFDDRYRYRSE